MEKQYVMMHETICDEYTFTQHPLAATDFIIHHYIGLLLRCCNTCLCFAFASYSCEKLIIMEYSTQ